MSAKFKPVAAAFGYEVLGSDDSIKAFSTPLATEHKFQGFADKFLATPADGIEDSYLKVVGKICNISLSAIYHDFESEQGSTDYGSEFDFVAAYKFNENYSVLIKYAAYDADDFSSDTHKVWLMLSAAF